MSLISFCRSSELGKEGRKNPESFTAGSAERKKEEKEEEEKFNKGNL